MTLIILICHPFVIWASKTGVSKWELSLKRVQGKPFLHNSWGLMVVWLVYSTSPPVEFFRRQKCCEVVTLYYHGPWYAGLTVLVAMASNVWKCIHSWATCMKRSELAAWAVLAVLQLCCTSCNQRKSQWSRGSPQRYGDGCPRQGRRAFPKGSGSLGYSVHSHRRTMSWAIKVRSLLRKCLQNSISTGRIQ